MKRSPISLVMNERGILTLDFIFALIVGLSFAMIFFALTLTLSLVEVTQYFSFAVARSAWSAHSTPAAQRALGVAKYNELRARPVFAAIFNRGWFSLPATPAFGDPSNGFNLEYSPDPADDNATFLGTRLRIEAKILDITIPMLGNSKTKSETGIANVQSFLGREVTTSECVEGFNRQRWGRIQGLDALYAGTPGTPETAVLIMTDNGC